MFNDGGYLQKADDGELKERIVKTTHASKLKVNAPWCTESQGMLYIDKDGTEVAQVHQYLQANGELWASGLPDSKRLFHNGVRYHVRSTKK